MRVGDRAELEANDVPVQRPAGTGTLQVTTRPGPLAQGPGGPTRHVIVELTASSPGTVTVAWISCAGTRC